MCSSTVLPAVWLLTLYLFPHRPTLQRLNQHRRTPLRIRHPRLSYTALHRGTHGRCLALPWLALPCLALPCRAPLLPYPVMYCIACMLTCLHASRLAACTALDNGGLRGNFINTKKDTPRRRKGPAMEQALALGAWTDVPRIAVSAPNTETMGAPSLLLALLPPRTHPSSDSSPRGGWLPQNT